MNTKTAATTNKYPEVVVAQTPAIESGQVYLPSEAHWLEEYVHEITMFPGGRHTDQVDSTSQALGWISSSVSSNTAMEYFRMQAEAMKTRLD
ncbi:MAG: hypothetical protein ACREXY_11235 [Gammaproteobacteria bacterium]